jgi:hypothetical protein
MFLCMRTTIDMPDVLMQRAKEAVARRGMTFKELVIDAVEKVLMEEPKPFSLRDASAGCTAVGGEAVSSATINTAIDALREPKVVH